jgi:FkbM family methyltransferase
MARGCGASRPVSSQHQCRYSCPPPSRSDKCRMILRPAYIYRPDQVARRLSTRRAPRGDVRVVLPWGLPTVVSSSDVLGRGIIRRNVHELAVTEAMWRLTSPADVAVDVGANAGYFTALLAFRAREVLSFEPHPRLAARLTNVIADWPVAYREKVTLTAAAVSERSGTAVLSIPTEFVRNEGLATLNPGHPTAEGIEVQTVSLDEAVGGRGVGVMKIDVEGHELSAFRGATELLKRGAIRDIFFEEHDPLPTPVSRLLSDHGYSTFGLAERFRGAQLSDPAASQPRWEAPTYLATLDPSRARMRIRLDGWNSLRPRSRGASRRAS